MIPPRGMSRNRFGRGTTVGYTRETGGTSGGERVRAIKRTLWIILFLNFGVAFAKLFWGMAIGSAAMQADGFHSMFDGTSNIVGLVGMGFASRPADEDHPYGHSKYETYASAIIGAMLLFAAYRIGSAGRSRALLHDAPPPTVDTMAFVGDDRHARRQPRRHAVGASRGPQAGQRHSRRRREPHRLRRAREHRRHRQPRPREARLPEGRSDRRAARDRRHRLHRVGRVQAGERDAFGRRADSRWPTSARSRWPCPGCSAATTSAPAGPRPRSSSTFTSRSIPNVTVARGHDIAEEVERAIADHYAEVVDVIAHLEPFDDYQQAKTEQESRAGLA